MKTIGNRYWTTLLFLIYSLFLLTNFNLFWGNAFAETNPCVSINLSAEDLVSKTKTKLESEDFSPKNCSLPEFRKRENDKIHIWEWSTLNKNSCVLNDLKERAKSLLERQGRVKEKELTPASNIFEGTELLKNDDGADVGAIPGKKINVNNVVNAVLSITIGLVGILLVILIAVLGVQIIYNEVLLRQGNVSGAADARKKIVDLLIGVVILLTSYLILDFVGPSLLKPDALSLKTPSVGVSLGDSLEKCAGNKPPSDEISIGEGEKANSLNGDILSFTTNFKTITKVEREGVGARGGRVTEGVSFERSDENEEALRILDGTLKEGETIIITGNIEEIEEIEVEENSDGEQITLEFETNFDVITKVVRIGEDGGITELINRGGATEGGGYNLGRNNLTILSTLLEGDTIIITGEIEEVERIKI